MFSKNKIEKKKSKKKYMSKRALSFILAIYYAASLQPSEKSVHPRTPKAHFPTTFLSWINLRCQFFLVSKVTNLPWSKGSTIWKKQAFSQLNQKHLFSSSQKLYAYAKKFFLWGRVVGFVHENKELSVQEKLIFKTRVQDAHLSLIHTVNRMWFKVKHKKYCK